MTSWWESGLAIQFHTTWYRSVVYGIFTPPVSGSISSFFLNILCQIGLNSNRRCSFRETFFSFHIVFAYFSFLPSYNPTNCRLTNAKILNFSELRKFNQTYFSPTHSFFRFLHVLQSYKMGYFVGWDLRKHQNAKISYFLQRPTILQHFLQNHKNTKIHITYW